MIAEVYDALLDAGAGHDKARRAAEALAGHEDRFNRIENRVEALDASVARRIDLLDSSLIQRIERSEASLRADIAAVRAEQVLVRWMLGTTLAMVVTLLFRSFLH